MPGFIQAFMDFEKKNRQVDLSIFHVWPSVRKGPGNPKNQFIFLSVEFYIEVILSLFAMNNSQK
jgi:hypothetical protein